MSTYTVLIDIMVGALQMDFGGVRLTDCWHDGGIYRETTLPYLTLPYLTLPYLYLVRGYKQSQLDLLFSTEYVLGGLEKKREGTRWALFYDGW
jgi:hypothetical protein